MFFFFCLGLVAFGQHLREFTLASVLAKFTDFKHGFRDTLVLSAKVSKEDKNSLWKLTNSLLVAQTMCVVRNTLL